LILCGRLIENLRISSIEPIMKEDEA